MTLRKIKKEQHTETLSALLLVGWGGNIRRPWFTTFDLRVHFLHRGYLLGGIGIERHRRGKTAVQRGVIMHFILQRCGKSPQVFYRAAACGGGVDDVGYIHAFLIRSECADDLRAPCSSDAG